MMITPFTAFPKIPRLSRDIIITEKIDGTNASILINEYDTIQIGSRTCWITPEDDNMGFAKWVMAHEEEVRQLGYGYHFGEWWGQKIQRGYGLTKKCFSLFNTTRWAETRPACCGLVPELYRGPFSEDAIIGSLYMLKEKGSQAAPGFMKPEGVVIFHVAANQMFKKTIEGDEKPKGSQEIS